MSEGTNHNDVPGDDLLEQSLAALKNQRVPDGPSADVFARTLAALSRPAPSHNERTTVVKRILTMTFAQRIAAVVMVTIGALVLWFMFTLFGGGTVSYAQVAQQIRQARSMTFKMTITSPGIPNPIEAKLYALEPGKLRNEGPGGVVTISRRENDKIRVLSLMPTVKVAQRMEVSLNDPQHTAKPDFVESFRKLADKKGEPLEEREINGVKAKGFRVNAEGQTASLWADPKTARPLVVEMDVPMLQQPQQGQAKVVMTDIVFDAPLDESLFSLEAPAGFEVKEATLQVSADVETNVINALRLYADATGGTFPDRLDDWAAFGKAVMPKSPTTNKLTGLDAATMQKMTSIGAVAGLLSTRKAGEDYAYLGKGATLGEKGRIVFWHRDKAKGTYRAIYADLTARDVSADVIPKP